MMLGGTQAKQAQQQAAPAPADPVRPVPEKRTSKLPPYARSELANAAPAPGSFVPRELLAVNLDKATLDRLQAQGYQIGPGSGGGLTRLAPPRQMTDPDAIKMLRELRDQLPDESVGHNFMYRPFGNGNAPAPDIADASGSADCQQPRRCYGRQLIEWNGKRAACAKSVKIGIIDTGFDREHPAFDKATIWNAQIEKENAIKSPNQHGTSVLALLAGNPASTTPGLVPGATFLLADAFFGDSKGEAMTDTLRLIRALDVLDRHGAQVINMSLVGPLDRMVYHRIKAMAHKGVVFVAAVGNNGPSGALGYPAAYDEVIAVTAVDNKRRNYAHAGRGPHVDVSAPGVGIWTAVPNRKEGYVTGTSFATVFVTAIASMAYNSTALGDPLNPKRGTLDSAREILRLITLKEIVPGADRETYGDGLAVASDCVQPADWAPTVSNESPLVRRVSLQ